MRGDAGDDAGMREAGPASGGDGGNGGGSGGGGGPGEAGLDAGPDATGVPQEGGLDTDAGFGRLVSLVVGAAGGVVSVPGITLTFPVGALAEPTEITIDRDSLDFPEGLDAVTPMYALGPDEITFARPVELCLTGDSAPGGDEQAIVLHTAFGGAAFEVATGCVLEPGSKVTRCCRIVHFSRAGMVNGPTCAGDDFLCNDGICRSSCGVRCRAGTSRCGGSCEPLDLDQHCGYCGNECTGGHACDDGDRVCACPADAAFECQGTCVANRDACLGANPCSTAAPFRCPDTTCAASYAACEGNCPSGTPHECPSGYCVANESECASYACPEGKPFLCYDDATCSDVSGGQCPTPLACPETAPVRCTPGGTCAQALALCPPGATCPEVMPAHCDTGPCVVDLSECASHPCPEGKPYLCADNVTCATSDLACP